MAQHTEGKFQDLSEALKENTKDVHEEAENTEFMKIFQKGQVSPHEFKLYLGSLYYIYVALEEESERNKGNPVYAPVYFPHELDRTATLEDDLEYFYGPTWKKDIQCHEATQKYVDRIHHVGQHEPELLVAHAYTRYLGDLSGGQILKKIAQKSLNLPNTGKGLSFFNFSGITNISKFKQLYRARMNSIPTDSSTIEKIVEEARKSFLLNIEVFQELQKLVNQGKPPQNNLRKSKLDFHTTGSNRTQTRLDAIERASTSRTTAEGQVARAEESAAAATSAEEEVVSPATEGQPSGAASSGVQAQGDCRFREKPVIAIVGHSMVFWAHHRAARSTRGSQLGFDDVATLIWIGRRGLKWQGLLPLLFDRAVLPVKPNGLIVHLGARKENGQAQMKHTDLLPSTPLLRWTLALFFLATTVVVGLYVL